MGLMDPIILKQRLARLARDNRQHPQNQPRDDLLKRADVLLDMARRLDNPINIIDSLLAAVDVQTAAQRFDSALSSLTACQQELDASPNDRLEVRMLAKKAQIQGALADWPAVSETCGWGIELAERNRHKVTAPYVQGVYLRLLLPLYSLGVRAAWELGDYPLMLKRTELSKGQAALHFSRLATQPEESVATAGELESAFRTACDRIATRPPGAVPEEWRNERRILWERLFVERLRAARTTSASDSFDFDLRAVQATLAVDEAVLYTYWLDGLDLLLVLLDRDGIDTIRRPLTEEQRTRCEKLAQAVLGPKPPTQLFLNEQLSELVPLLLPESGHPMLQEKRKLLISPHRLLHCVPFHALCWQGEALIEHLAISYIPNLSSLLIRYEPSSQPRLLAIGIRDYHIPGKSLRSLEDAELELDDILAVYQGCGVPLTILRGADGSAVRTRLQRLIDKDALRRFTCLHLATHGENVPGDNPMESCLHLQDAVLDGLEISHWRLNADLVVLSACCSGQRPVHTRGVREELPGDDLFGLQAAFFAAGARRILGSLWAVESSVARQVAVDLHHHLALGLAPELALQAALKAQRASLLGRRVNLWAPFFLSSMGRPKAVHCS